MDLFSCLGTLRGGLQIDRRGSNVRTQKACCSGKNEESSSLSELPIYWTDEKEREKERYREKGREKERYQRERKRKGVIPEREREGNILN